MSEIPLTRLDLHKTLRQTLRQRRYPETEFYRVKSYVLDDEDAAPNELLTQSEQKKFAVVMKALWEDYPIAYLVGYQDFAGLQFIITPDVLIPRPESEELLKAIEDIKFAHKALIIDVGTGSGALVISLYHRLDKYFSGGIPSRYQFAAVDISRAALDVARKNEAALLIPRPHYEDNPIAWHQGSLLDPIMSNYREQLTTHSIFIIANLPYIDERDYPRLEQSTRYEPKIALVPPNNRNLIQELIRQAPLGSHLYLEQPAGSQTIEISHIQKEK